MNRWHGPASTVRPGKAPPGVSSVAAWSLLPCVSLPRSYYFLSFSAGPFARSPTLTPPLNSLDDITYSCGRVVVLSFVPPALPAAFHSLHTPTTYPLFCIVPSPPKHKQHQSLPHATPYLIRLRCLQTPRHTFNTRAGSREAIFRPGPINS